MKQWRGEAIEQSSMRENPPSKKDPLRSLFSNWAGVDCLESLALNVSTDFASMNYIHFAKVLRTLLAPRSNH